MARASVRRSVRIHRPPDEVWAVVGDPGRIVEWFPGIVACEVNGDERIVTAGSGLPMPQHLLTVDRLQRRFQYRMQAPILTEHLATIDVIDLEDGSSLVSYAVDADPATLALVFGGAGGNALRHLASMLEGRSEEGPR